MARHGKCKKLKCNKKGINQFQNAENKNNKGFRKGLPAKLCTCWGIIICIFRVSLKNLQLYKYLLNIIS